MQSDRAILSIKSNLDDLTCDPLEINEHFRTFYKHLYKSECKTNEAIQNDFLDKLQFQKLSEKDKEIIDRPLAITDIMEAIGNLNSGRAPGPHGLPVEFYKKCKNKLAQPLLDMFKEIGTLPDSLRLATITLILKPNKPHTDCASYRGISLMGCDMKILCKVLAKRLERHVPKLILDDQQGFVQQRQGYHNIRRVLNILYEKHNARDTAMLAVDA